MLIYNGIFFNDNKIECGDMLDKFSRKKVSTWILKNGNHLQ